jgi:hypothetical protein
VFSPDLVAGGVVVDAGEVSEVVEGVGVRNAEFVGEFSGGGTADTCGL